jgi:pimeloyl-ACP methyl ester carboxylesterase
VDVATRTVEVPDGTLELDVAGDPARPAIAFLHPGLWDRRTWDGHFERYAERYHVVRYDARGYGRSTRPVEGRAYSHVEDLIAVLDDVGIDRAALIGNSMGGATAVETAVEHPDRVTALVLVAPGLNADDDLTSEEEAEFARYEPAYDAAMERGDLEAAREVQVSMWTQLGVEDPAGRRIRDIAFDNIHEMTMDESGRRDLDPPILERLGDVAVPTLVLPADHDPLVLQRVSRIYADAIPNARLVEIPQTDHVLNVRQPDAFDEVVLAFLAEVLG